MNTLRRMLAQTVAAVLAWCLLASPALAVDRAKNFSLSPMVGGYVFEGDQDLDNALAYSLALGYNLTDSWSTEFVLNYFKTDAKGSGSSSVDGLVYRLDALYHFLPGKTLVPYIAGGLGGMTLDPDKKASNTDFLLDYGVGLKYFLTEDLALRGDVRHILAFGDPENNFIYTAGLTYMMGSRAVEAPKPIRPLARKPEVPDLSVQPEKASADKRGETIPPLDSDNDGVIDELDACPFTAEGLLVDETGCPVSITLSVEFDVDKTDIKPRYHAELARGAEFIRQYVNHKILVAGHTDSTGTEAYNEGLSQRRAESVRAYLIENFGLDGERLLARGFGETSPIATNDSVEGRRLNRRVELSCRAATPQ